MVNIPAIIIITVLCLVIVAELIMIYIYQKNLKVCETNQNPNCYTYLCDTNLSGPICSKDPCLCYPSRTDQQGRKYCGIAPFSPIS